MSRPETGRLLGVRIATFNILSGRSPDDDVVDEQRFADAVRTLDADVLGLQEVDRNQPRSQHADLTALAAEAMGAHEHRFVAALAGTPGTTWSAVTGEEQPDSAAYGIALLSRYPVLGWSVVRLPPLPVRTPFWFHGRRAPEWVRDEPRVAVVAQVDTPAGRLSVANTHLSFLRRWNGHQLRILLRALHDQPDPLVLLGDLNMTSVPAARITGMRPLVGGHTFPASRPAEQIDHILARGGALEGVGGPVRLPMSDHLALAVEIADT
jgi:endonuclease/exonuclease/phosphatase family metal-dependent hydrolase